MTHPQAKRQYYQHPLYIYIYKQKTPHTKLLISL